MDSLRELDRILPIMKSDSLNMVLNIVLAVFVLLASSCAYLTLSRTQKVRSLNQTAGTCNALLVKTQNLLNDLNAYNQHSPNPELTRVLSGFQAKPGNQ